MDKYLVVIAKAKNNFAAFSLDAWGCVATGKTVEETTVLMKEALHLHIESLLGEGEIKHPVGISQNIANGVFAKDQIAEEYFITEIEVFVPQHV